MNGNISQHVAKLHCLAHTPTNQDHSRPLVANKQTRNRLTQEDTKPNIQRASGQTLRGYDRQEGGAREPPPPTLSNTLFHESSSHPRERLKPSGLESGSLLGRYLHPPIRSFTSPPSGILDRYSLELDDQCRCGV